MDSLLRFCTDHRYGIGGRVGTLIKQKDDIWNQKKFLDLLKTPTLDYDKLPEGDLVNVLVVFKVKRPTFDLHSTYFFRYT